MQGEYKVITLCGSTKFKDDFIKESARLTLEGNIVLSVGLFSHGLENSKEWKDRGIKDLLDDIHLRKIDMADEIFVINPGDYIDESTMGEIAYAKNCNKPVNYLVRHIDPIPIGTVVKPKYRNTLGQTSKIKSITTFNKDTFRYGKYAYTLENGEYLYEFEFEIVKGEQ